MDRELVIRAQQRDHEAFGRIVRASIDRLYATARLILRDQHQAEDAVQDALVEAWRSLPSLRDPDRIDAWLHRLLVRACQRVIGRDSRRRVTEIPLLEEHDSPTPDALAGLAARDQLDRALGRIAVDHRTALVLTYFADLPHDAVATALGVPPGTVKSRLHRALQALRASLEADERAAATLTGRIA